MKSYSSRELTNEYAFVALFDYADDGINITFPDLPGCFSCAEKDDTAGALKNAKETLGLHLFAMEQDNEAVPVPRPITEIPLTKNQIPVLVDVFMPSVRATVTTKFVKRPFRFPRGLRHWRMKKR